MHFAEARIWFQVSEVYKTTFLSLQNLFYSGNKHAFDGNKSAS